MKFYQIYSLILTVAVIVLFYQVYRQDKKFEEITVERINVVEQNGDLKMVISNKARQHNGIINGKELPQRQRQAGLIFFNAAGDECGGLVFDGDTTSAGLILSVDQFRDDQIMQMQYLENTMYKVRKYGLQLWDFPKENSYEERMERFADLDTITDRTAATQAYRQMKTDSLLSEQRLFLGKQFNEQVGLFIYDKTGNPRIQIFVDEDNQTRFEMLDENGTALK